MGTILGILLGVLSIGLGIAQFKETKNQNEVNTSIAERQNELAEQTFEYNKEFNALQMEREDTAIQRRVADLKAAGLSPLLAAGSAAASGGSQINSPDLQSVDFKGTGLEHFTGMGKDVYNMALQGYDAYRQSQQSEAEISLLKSQTEKYDQDIYKQTIENKYLEQKLYDEQSERLIKINQRITDIQKQLAQIDNTKESTLAIKLKNELQLIEKQKKQIELNILEHDWQIYKHSPFTSSRVDKGTQSTAGQYIEDTELLAGITEATRERQGISNQPTQEVIPTPQPVEALHESKPIRQDMEEDGSIIYGKYQNKGEQHKGIFKGGNGYRVMPDGTVYYGGYRLRPEHFPEFKARMESGDTQIPVSWLYLY